MKQPVPPAAADKRGVKPALRAALPVETPFGPMVFVENDGRLCELRFGAGFLEGETLRETPLLRRAAAQLLEYCRGERTAFDLPMVLEGTPFQRLVWETLAKTVPYGQTVSYGELAKRCGRPAAARAVGMANHRNPLPILIPCHRVIGANGSLVGYGGGLDLKQRLLAMETSRQPR